uniref:Ice-binding family protein n=1 Tax=Adineta environmental sample TaxID=1193592 RepID=A0AAU7VEF9_9BILA
MLLSVTLIILLCFATITNNVLICPTLRSAANFAVVAASSVSSNGLTVINGNLAISPSVSLTGFNSTGVIYGITELGTATALQAQQDVLSAYNDLKGMPLTAQMTGVDLAGKTLEPGIYKFDSAAGIDTFEGILTLNGSGIYIFQVGSALTTSANSEIRLINGAKIGCIFWQVGSSATLGPYSRFVGNILAYASVGLATGVIYNGSIYAQTAAISFIADTVTKQTSCDVCQIIPDPIQSRFNRNLPQNTSLSIVIMLLVSFFQR